MFPVEILYFSKLEEKTDWSNQVKHFLFCCVYCVVKSLQWMWKNLLKSENNPPYNMFRIISVCGINLNVWMHIVDLSCIMRKSRLQDILNLTCTSVPQVRVFPSMQERAESFTGAGAQMQKETSKERANFNFSPIYTFLAVYLIIEMHKTNIISLVDLVKRLCVSSQLYKLLEFYFHLDWNNCLN